MMWQDRAFVTTWNTENAGSATKTIVIPTSSNGSYACTVDWGDGTTNYMTTYNDANWTHVYASTGTYTVKIYGKFVCFAFNNLGDKLKLLTVSRWGPDFRLGTSQDANFYGCTNLTITATDVLNLQGTTALPSTFRGCTSIVTIPNINLWDTSAVTNMSSMFQGATAFNQDISAWNTAAVTNMSFMFSGATAFNQPIGSWNTGNVTTMASMFSGAPSFNQALAWGSKTQKVTTMASMFSGATTFNRDVSGWDIRALTNATTMFTNSAFALANYNLLLDSVTGWPSQATIQTGVTFSAGTAHYSGANAIAGRATLVTTKTWTVTDGGTP